MHLLLDNSLRRGRGIYKYNSKNDARVPIIDNKMANKFNEIYILTGTVIVNGYWTKP